MKKISSLALVVAMLMQLLCVSVSAANPQYSIDAPDSVTVMQGGTVQCEVVFHAPEGTRKTIYRDGVKTTVESIAYTNSAKTEIRAVLNIAATGIEDGTVRVELSQNGTVMASKVINVFVVGDLRINAEPVNMVCGQKTEVQVQFAGKGIDSVSASATAGISGSYSVDWAGYPNTCTATFALTATKNGTVTFYLRNSKLGVIQQTSFSVTVTPGLETVVTEMKEAFRSLSSQQKENLDFLSATFTECLGTELILENIGAVASSLPAGGTTAAKALLNSSNLESAVTLGMAQYLTYRAQEAAKRVDQLCGQELNRATALELIAAVREMESFSLAAMAIMKPVFEEYAEHASDSKLTQAMFLSNAIVDGALDGIMSQLGDMDEVAKVGNMLRDGCDISTSVISVFLQTIPTAYEEYAETWERWTALENRLVTSFG